ncbi:MAG: prolipoprotein diacylglyceryl transferase [Clostridia bacterium]|nr:prolipoprotein diacylglyceryl transferase [Clostridia bacterium]
MKPSLTVFGLRLHSYGLCAAGGMLLALALMLLICKKRRYDVYRSILYFLLAVVTGLGSAAFTFLLVTYTPSEIVAGIKDGTLTYGYVYYGGFVGGLLAVWLVSRFTKTRLAYLENILLPPLALAHACGRVGCYLAGCCYGRASHSPLAVRFPSMDESVLPVQLFECAAEALICAYLVYCVFRRKKHILLRYVFLYAPVRFVLEFWRGDEIRGHWLAFSTSQWISLVLTGAGIVYTAFILKTRRKA